MATIAVRRNRLLRSLEPYKAAMKRTDAKIGELMSKRVDIEDGMAEIYQKLNELDALEMALPKG